MLRTEDINHLIGVDDSWKAPQALMSILLNRNDRIKLFKDFLKCETDMSFDWFHMYFQDEAADRKKKKQDFTPNTVSKIMDKLVEIDSDSDMYFEPAAGTGGITIQHYWNQCLKYTPWAYSPKNHFHQLEELSDRAIPFLLFNLSIRGMNGTVTQIDSLSREDCKGVFFIQNLKDDALSFSSINLMPYSDKVKKEFNIKSWSKQLYPEHVEDSLGDVFDAKPIKRIKEIR